MMRSLYSGVSGLRNHQIGMDVVGNNLANVNTVGYKAGRAMFQDILAQTKSISSAPQDGHGGVNPVQVGLGMAVASIDTIMTKGNIEVTNKNTDIAIDGSGMFVLGNDDATNLHYTRAGDFSPDADGHFVNPATGLYVQGWQGQRDSDTGEIVINNNQPTAPIALKPGDIMPAAATQNASITGNLDHNTPLRIDPVTVSFVNDNGGGAQSYNFQIEFQRAHPTENFYIWKAVSDNINDLDLDNLYNDVLREPPPDAASNPDLANRFPKGKPIMGIMELDDNGKVIGMYENIDAPAWTFDPYVGNSGSSGEGEGNLFFNEFDSSIDNSATAALNGVTNANIRDADNVTGNGDGMLTEKEIFLLKRSRTKSDRLYGRLAWRNQQDWADGTLGDPNNTTGPISPSNSFIIDTSAIDGYTDNNNPENGNLDTTDDVRIFIPDTRIGQGPSKITFRPDTSTVGAAPDFEADSGNEVTATVRNNAETQKSTSVTVYDSLGNPYTITVTFEKMSLERWMWHATNPLDETKIGGYGQIAFDSKGNYLEDYAITYQSPSDPFSEDRFTDTYPSGDGAIGVSPILDVNDYVPDFDGDGTITGVDADGNGVDDGLEAGRETGVGTDQAVVAPASGAEYDDYMLDERSIGYAGIYFDPDEYSGSPAPPRGPEKVKIKLDLSDIKQMAGASDVTFNEQDGHPMGVLESFSFDKAGIVHGIYDNGFHQPIAQIAIAIFNNPSGLLRVGENQFIETANSGIPKIDVAGRGGRGPIYPGALEMSNVDLSEEFTRMIILQRGFQASSKTIQTSDQMLQELINLKR